MAYMFGGQKEMIPVSKGKSKAPQAKFQPGAGKKMKGKKKGLKKKPKPGMLAGMLTKTFPMKKGM